MKDPDLRQALKDELDNAGENGMLNFSSVIGRGIPALEIHSVKRAELKKQYEGFTVGEIAAREGKHVIDALLDLAVADNLETTFSTPPLPYDADQMREMANSSYAIPGISDGGAHTKFMTFGAYPTEYLTKIARDDALVTLEHAHWSLSALPAMASGFRDRGFIREGMAADLVVYDLERLAMGPQHKAWDYPANEWRQVRQAEGYRWIIVNGAVTFEDGACTNTTPGLLLRHGAAA
jgi:N-acyl-D-aspartate/D-glutamate deacylase